MARGKRGRYKKSGRPMKAVTVRLSDETIAKIVELGEKWGVSRLHLKTTVLTKLVDEHAAD